MLAWLEQGRKRFNPRKWSCPPRLWSAPREACRPKIIRKEFGLKKQTWKEHLKDVTTQSKNLRFFPSFFTICSILGCKKLKHSSQVFHFFRWGSLSLWTMPGKKCFYFFAQIVWEHLLHCRYCGFGIIISCRLQFFKQPLSPDLLPSMLC